MIKAIIKNNEGKILDEQQGSTLESLKDFLAPFETSGVYGQPQSSFEQLVSEAIPAVLDEQGAEISPEIAAVYETIIVPAEYSIEFVEINSELAQYQANQEAERFLAQTDWKVLRHIGQQALGLATTLTSQEYQELEQERQSAREGIVR